jgi:hypothetical protein
MNLLFVPNLFELSPVLALVTVIASVALLMLPLFASPGPTGPCDESTRRANTAGIRGHRPVPDDSTTNRRS